MSNLSERSLSSLKGVHPDLVKIIRKAVEESPVDFTITSGARTTAQQKKLYAQGRTAPGKRVTNADGIRNKSNHQAKADGYGYAVDLYPYYDGSVRVHESDVPEKLGLIAIHIKATAACFGCTVEWGGDWKSLKDYPHFELK